MAKKIIRLTESDLENIVKKVIREQSEERKMTMAIQKFLNQVMNAKLEVDGLTGQNSKTEAAIMKLQQMLGVTPTDGVWGPDTETALENKKPEWFKVWKKLKPGIFF